MAYNKQQKNKHIQENEHNPFDDFSFWLHLAAIDYSEFLSRAEKNDIKQKDEE